MMKKEGILNSMRMKKKLLIPLVLLLSFLGIVGVVIAVATLGTGVSLRKDVVLKVPARNATMKMGDDIDVSKVEVRTDSIRLTITAIDFDLKSDGSVFASVRNKSLQSSNPAYLVTYDGTTGVLGFAPPSGDHTLTANVTTSPTLDLKANGSDNPGLIRYNTSASLTWNATGTTGSPPCTASGSWSGGRAASGSEPTGNLKSSQTYTLTCTMVGGGTRQDSVTVNVAKAGDLNVDGFVNIKDISILAGKWGTNDPVADINGDGTVSIKDVSILAGNWGS